MPIGAGLCPAGIAPAGYGVPDTVGPPASIPLPDPKTGLAQTGRFLDPTTKDYAFTSDGRLQGMPTVRQLVQLAIKTTLGSSALIDLGIDMKRIRDKADGFDQKVTSVLTDAIAPLVRQGLVQIDSVEVFDEPNPDAAIGILNWTDLTTGQPQPTPF